MSIELGADSFTPTAKKITTIKAIRVRASFVALHRWRECPHEEVAFLRDYHRHVFGVEVELLVGHADRQLEFFLVQNNLRELLRNTWEGQQLELSCEEMALRLLESLDEKYPGAVNYVMVDEDGENAGLVYNQQVIIPTT